METSVGDYSFKYTLCGSYHTSGSRCKWNGERRRDLSPVLLTNCSRQVNQIKSWMQTEFSPPVPSLTSVFLKLVGKIAFRYFPKFLLNFTLYKVTCTTILIHVYSIGSRNKKDTSQSISVWFTLILHIFYIAKGFYPQLNT